MQPGTEPDGVAMTRGHEPINERWRRVFSGLAALAVLWVLVYWWWEPRGPRITFDDGSPAPLRVASRQATPPPAAEVDAPPPAIRRPEPAALPPAQPSTQASTQPSAAVVPPRFRDYTIRPNDTLRSIARRELGSESHAEAIARANPLKDTERLRPGRTLRIPLDPTNIQGKPVERAAPPAPVPQVPAVPPADPAAVARSYAVRPGDTLSRIAQEQYGSSRFVGLILEANRLADADALRVGQTLTLPPKPR